MLASEGKHDEALKAMSAAADAEDKTEKHAVTPVRLLPRVSSMRVMLLERGMAKEALMAFEFYEGERTKSLPRLRWRSASGA